MTDGPEAHKPPDPPGGTQDTAYKPPRRLRGDSRPSRSLVNTPTTPAYPSSTPLSERPTVAGLVEFKAGKARKRQATAAPEDRSRPKDPQYLGTPRSVRFKNLFTGTANTPSLLEVTQKMYELIESAIKFLKKGAEKITIGSESAADIKTLAARMLELAEQQDDIPAIRRNPFLSDEEDHRIERALAGANTFGCKVPELVNAKLDKIVKDLAEIKLAAAKPSSGFSFRTPKSLMTIPSYALAASKHAPRPPSTRPADPTTFRPVLHRKQPPTPPTSLSTTNNLTLTQADREEPVLTTPSYPTLIALVNAKLAEANVKENPTDAKRIQIRSVHRHPSNDVVLYATTPQQADLLRKQADRWVHLLSPHLKLHEPVHTVVVHGIPATFQPADQQHLDMLMAMNQETLTPAPLFVKCISPNAIQRGVSHSSIRIGFKDASQAKKAVEQQVFFGRYNKKTEYGRKAKPRCMNCLQDGHTSNHCKADPLCPYCAKGHPADQCELKGTRMSNCTACARALKLNQPETHMGELFSTTPANLSHSPLDPTCPTRVAQKRAEATKAGPTANARAGSSSTMPACAEKSGNVQPEPGLILVPETPAAQTSRPFNAGANDANMNELSC